jgi:hypothetical protein
VHVITLGNGVNPRVTPRPFSQARAARAQDRDRRCVASVDVGPRRLACGRPDLRRRAGSGRYRSCASSQNPPDVARAYWETRSRVWPPTTASRSASALRRRKQVPVRRLDRCFLLVSRRRGSRPAWSRTAPARARSCSNPGNSSLRARWPLSDRRCLSRV